MTSKTKRLHGKAGKVPAPVAIVQGETGPDDAEQTPIIERPDGFYWQDVNGHQEFGPFETYELAVAERDAMSEEAVAPSEALHKAEQDIGIADWIDPETGEPAEGESPPHLAGE